MSRRDREREIKRGEMRDVAGLEVFRDVSVSCGRHCDKTTRYHNTDGHNTMDRTCLNILSAKE
jgi:hypothetical protein